MTITEQLERLYERIPKFRCNEGCTGCCGPLMMSKTERARLPAGSCSGIDCPFAKWGKCTVYENRPLLCRLFGVTDDMPCPYDCGPAQLWTKAESRALMEEYENIINQEGGAVSL